jgi:hypothetical protein
MARVAAEDARGGQARIEKQGLAEFDLSGVILLSFTAGIVEGRGLKISVALVRRSSAKAGLPSSRRKAREDCVRLMCNPS